MNKIDNLNEARKLLSEYIIYKPFNELHDGDDLMLFFYCNVFNLRDIRKDDDYIYFETNHIEGEIYKEDYNKLINKFQIGNINSCNVIKLFDLWDRIDWNIRGDLTRFKFSNKTDFYGLNGNWIKSNFK